MDSLSKMLSRSLRGRPPLGAPHLQMLGNLLLGFRHGLTAAGRALDVAALALARRCGFNSHVLHRHVDKSNTADRNTNQYHNGSKLLPRFCGWRNTVPDLAASASRMSSSS